MKISTEKHEGMTIYKVSGNGVSDTYFKTRIEAEREIEYKEMVKTGNMRPSKICHYFGIKTILELCEEAGLDRQKAMRWAKDRPRLFELLCAGVAFERKKRDKF